MKNFAVILSGVKKGLRGDIVGAILPMCSVRLSGNFTTNTHVQ
jgi:hypothetical protein